MDNFNKELIKFIKNGTCSFTSTIYIKNILIKNGYKELDEKEVWHITEGKYFVIRNDASIIAFNLNKNAQKQFKIVCTHNDTPAFLIKPNPDYYENGYLKLNVAPYGGILNYGFMDRPLSIAGRIIKEQKNVLEKEIIDLKEMVAIIPSVAIHQNDNANSNLDLNTEIDLMPIISLDKNYSLEKLLQEKLHLKNKIKDFDLYLYNLEEPHILNKEFLASPRIDNLTCTYAALKSFINNMNNSINILAIFNSEEIGSNTYEGADSNVLIDIIKKICMLKKLDLSSSLANSIIISADNTHARHPNHDDKSDHTNTPVLNDGILIMHEMNGTTNAITSSLFRNICKKAKVRCSYYTSRNDLSVGSTQSGASLKHLSINSLDIGLPMLAMHSSLELIGLKDTYDLYKALVTFYKTNYEFKDNKIILK